MNVATDPYRSRTGTSWEAVPRVDPVVYGSVHDGPLTPAQLAAFDRDGFLFVDDILSGDEVARALDETLAASHARSHTEEVVAEPDSDVVRSVFRVHQTCPFLGQLSGDSRLVAVARQILGSEVYVHQSRVNVKPALDGREFFWHSDFETWHVEDGMPRMRALSVSIHLTPTTPFNGPLMLIPGSHRTFVRTVGETPEAHYKQSLRRQEIGVPPREALARLTEAGGIVAPEGPAGSAVFFDCNTLHASSGNLSPEPRTNLFFVYNSVENRLTDPFGGLPPRPAHIATRQPVPVGLARC